MLGEVKSNDTLVGSVCVYQSWNVSSSTVIFQFNFWRTLQERLSISKQHYNNIHLYSTLNHKDGLP